MPADDATPDVGGDLLWRRLAGTSLDVPTIGFGTSPLASAPDTYGYEVSQDRAVATVEAILTSSAPFLDTSNGYGDHGESEIRIGLALRRAGGLPDGAVLATKVDPTPGSEDFSGDRVRASFAESLDRLGVDRIRLLHLHDPERIPYEVAMAPDGPVAALVQLRDQGVVDHLGVAGGPPALLSRYLATGEFEVLLSHNRFSLLDRSAQQLFEDARARGIGVLNAAPYGGGMLAKGPAQQPRYAYGMGSSAATDAARAMAAACDRHVVLLAAVALQYSLRSPLVDSTIVGVSAPERVEQTLALAAVLVPEGLWAELESLVPPPATWLNPPAG